MVSNLDVSMSTNLAMREIYTILSAYAPPIWATLIAGIFVIASVCLSTFLLFNHLTAYNNPEEQKFLIGVILMVPCYAIESYISFLDPSISVDIEILRDCYESFAMYCFGRYLVACLGMPLVKVGKKEQSNS